MRQGAAGPARDDRGEWVSLAAMAPQRPFEQSRDFELRLARMHRGERIAQRRARECRGGTNRGDLARVLPNP